MQIPKFRYFTRFLYITLSRFSMQIRCRYTCSSPNSYQITKFATFSLPWSQTMAETGQHERRKQGSASQIKAPKINRHMATSWTRKAAPTISRTLIDQIMSYWRNLAKPHPIPRREKKTSTMAEAGKQCTVVRWVYFPQAQPWVVLHCRFRRRRRSREVFEERRCREVDDPQV
jgi:hypothetical protein